PPAVLALRESEQHRTASGLVSELAQPLGGAGGVAVELPERVAAQLQLGEDDELDAGVPRLAERFARALPVCLDVAESRVELGKSQPHRSPIPSEPDSDGDCMDDPHLLPVYDNRGC